MEREVVRYILDCFDQKQSQAQIARALKEKYSLKGNTAEWAIEMASTGRFRAAVLYDGSPYPTSDIDTDPYLQAAIEMVSAELLENPVLQEKPQTTAELLADYHQESADKVMILHQLAKREEDSPQIDTLFVEALQSEDEQIRSFALVGIRSRKLKAAIPTLQDHLDLVGSEKQLTLSQALYELGEEELGLSYLISLTRDPEAFVRYEAAFSLGELGDRKAIPALKALRKDKVIPKRYDEGGTLRKSADWSVGEQAKKAIKKIKPGWRIRL